MSSSQDCSNYDHNKNWDAVFPFQAIPLKLSSTIAFVAGVAVFANTVRGNFVFDDSEAVLNNQDVLPESPLSNILLNDFWGTSLTHNRSHKSYRPVTILTFRWNVWIAGGIHPFGFHLTNVILHGIVSALVVPVTNRLYGGSAPRMSFLTSLLFAVHPVHTEAVAGVVGRADLLCTLFSFGSLLSYMKAVETCLESNRLKSTSYLFTSVFLCSLALFSKEQGITVLGLCFAYDLIIFLKGRFYQFPLKVFEKLSYWLGISRQRVSPNHSCTDSEVFTYCNNPHDLSVEKTFFARLVVLVSVGLLLLITRWRVMGSIPPIFQPVDNPPSFAESLWTRVWSYNYLYSLNVWLLLCPEWLCFDWSMGCVPLITSMCDLRVSAVIFLWVGLTSLLWRGLVSTNSNTGRTLNMSIAVVIIPFLPASNLFFRVGFVLAERVLYMPSLGFCMLVVLGMRTIMSQKPACRQMIMNVFTCLLLMFGARCILRSNEWLEECTLFRSALAICPLNAKVHYNVAKNAGDLGDKNLALKEYSIALKLHSQYDQAMNNMANILRDDGKLSEAESLLRQALTIRPDFAAAWMNLGIVLAGMKRHKEAEVSYSTALTHRSHYPECLYNLGNLYLDLKMHNEAFKTFRKAVNLRPEFSIAWNNMVILLESTGNLIQAREVAEEALSILPDDAGLHFNLANTLGKMSLFLEAESHFKEAVNLSPTNPLYHSNMGVLYHRWKKYDQAEVKYKEALILDPHLTSAKNNLAMLKSAIKIQ